MENLVTTTGPYHRGAVRLGLDAAGGVDVGQPVGPYSKRQTEGHFVERLRTGLVIQHGPERACDWSRASTIAPSYTCANPTRRSALRSAEHAFEVTLGLLGGGGFGNTEGVWGPLPVSMVRSRSPGVDEYGRASPHGTTA